MWRSSQTLLWDLTMIAYTLQAVRISCCRALCTFYLPLQPQAWISCNDSEITQTYIHHKRSILSHQMSHSGISVQKWRLCSKGKHGQSNLPKAASSRGDSTPFSTPSSMPSRWSGCLVSLLPCVAARPAYQGPCSHGTMQPQGAPVHECKRWHEAWDVHLSSHQHLWPWHNRTPGIQT